jgi:hypothetical protein
MRVLASLAGFVYGFVGLVSLIHFFILLATLSFYAASISFERQFLPVIVLYAFPLFNTVVCFFLAYGFFVFRRWARIAAIAYNGFWLLMMSEGLRDPLSAVASMSPFGAILAIMIIGFLIGVILFCATKRGRELMNA